MTFRCGWPRLPALPPIARAPVPSGHRRHGMQSRLQSTGFALVKSFKQLYIIRVSQVSDIFHPCLCKVSNKFHSCLNKFHVFNFNKFHECFIKFQKKSSKIQQSFNGFLQKHQQHGTNFTKILQVSNLDLNLLDRNND